MEPNHRTFAERYREASNTPRIRQMRVRSRIKILVVIFIAPFAFVAIKMCELLKVPTHTYLPIIIGIVAAAPNVAVMIAEKARKARDPAPNEPS